MQLPPILLSVFWVKSKSTYPVFRWCFRLKQITLEAIKDQLQAILNHQPRKLRGELGDGIFVHVLLFLFGEENLHERIWKIPPRFDGMEIPVFQVKDDQKMIPSGELTYPPMKRHVADDFPFPVWWDMYPFPGGYSKQKTSSKEELSGMRFFFFSRGLTG